MAKVTELFEESFDYVRSPEYAMPLVIFCIGFGLTTFSIQSSQTNGYSLWQPFLIFGGTSLTIWSLTQAYILYLNR